MFYNLPNFLTLLRVLLIPVFVGLFYYPSSSSNLFAAIVFVIAALTDLLDGYLARRLQQTTKFGAFLDPVADKIMVCTALVLIVEYYSVHVQDYFPHVNLTVSLPAMVIIAREILVSALREWMAEIGQRAKVGVNWIGKWKTTIQMTAIALLVWRPIPELSYLGIICLAIATILTIWSMIVYLKAGLSHMEEEPAANPAANPAAQPGAAQDTTAQEATAQGATAAAATTAAAHTASAAAPFSTAEDTDKAATPTTTVPITPAAPATSVVAESSAVAPSADAAISQATSPQAASQAAPTGETSDTAPAAPSAAAATTSLSNASGDTNESDASTASKEEK